MVNDLLPSAFGKIFRMSIGGLGNGDPSLLGFDAPTPEDGFTWFRSETILDLNCNDGGFPC